MKSVRSGQSRSISPARLEAFDILLRVEETGAHASDLLAYRQDSLRLPEDNALAREIVLGVLRYQGALDYFIERYTDRAVSRLDPAVKIALRMGIYQLRYLDRVPHSAAVNESVSLVKRAGVTSAAGLANAVLRKAAASLGDVPGETRTIASEKKAAELSHPDWLLAKWSAWLGDEESTRLAVANNQRANISFRANGCRGHHTDEVVEYMKTKGVIVRRSLYVGDALIVESGAAATVYAAMQQGLIYMQDEASQMVSLLVDPQPGERLLDLCAAPGSKATHLASLTENASWILACDKNQRRLTALAETTRRLGAGNVDPIALDGTSELPFLSTAKFDRVLVDAPCTGTGTLRRNPEIKWRLSADDPMRLSEVQIKLLEHGASVVGAGGRLVYSTCSLEPEENEIVVDRFIRNSTCFKLIEPKVHSDLLTSNGMVRTFPHRHDMDGFFAAVFERRRQ